MNEQAFRIGVIADTHDLLRDEALAALRGVDQLIHAGDICAPAVLATLRGIAPLTVVRGNNDRGPWAEALPETATLTVGGVTIHVIHDLARLDFDPRDAPYQVLVAGHSHRPRAEWINGIWMINPGSAGPRRFSLPITLALLEVHQGKVSARLVDLQKPVRLGV